MANVYVRSGAGGSADGSSWANAYLTLAAAFTAKAAGDTFWVSEDHAETQASAMALTSKGTANNPSFIYCVNHSGSVPPVSADLRTTATITTTGANAIAMTGGAYYYGISFQCGTSGSPGLSISTTDAIQVFNTCSLQLLSASNQTLTLGSQRCLVILDNVTVQFGAVASSIQEGGDFIWKNTASAILGTPPTAIISQPTNPTGNVLIEAVDLSAVGTLIASGGGAGSGTYVFKDCKLKSSVIVNSSGSNPHGVTVYVVRSDSGATNYRSEKYDYRGTLTTETTIIRTGGATDGTTPFSWKIVTTANDKWIVPFDVPPIQIWAPTAGVPLTIVLEGTWNSGSVPNNDDIWLEAEYLGSAASPLGSLATSTKADNLATGAAITASSQAWGGGGSGAGWAPFKLSVTFTPQQAGPLTLRVKAGKASSTFYIDPSPAGMAAVQRSYMGGLQSPVMISECFTGPIGRLISHQRGTPY